MTTSDAAAKISDRRKQMILLLACIGQFMVVLDIAIVTVALPSMKHSLDFSATGLQWVVNAYTLVFAALLLSCGALRNVSMTLRHLPCEFSVALFSSSPVLAD